jgi:hypothetical protein
MHVYSISTVCLLVIASDLTMYFLSLCLLVHVQANVMVEQPQWSAVRRNDTYLSYIGVRWRTDEKLKRWIDIWWRNRFFALDWLLHTSLKMWSLSVDRIKGGLAHFILLAMYKEPTTKIHICSPKRFQFVF